MDQHLFENIFCLNAQIVNKMTSKRLTFQLTLFFLNPRDTDVKFNFIQNASEYTFACMYEYLNSMRWILMPYLV